MASRDIQWKGAKEMDKLLEKLPRFLEKKVLDQAAKAGLRHFVNKVKPQIPLNNLDDVHRHMAANVILRNFLGEE